MDLSKFCDRRGGYFVNDTDMMDAKVAFCRIIGHCVNDSRKEAEFICTTNQVDINYLGFLLQTRYLTPFFRNALLQYLLFKSSVAKEDLNRSLGWDVHHSFTGHDLQKFARHVCKKLENKAKVRELMEVSNKGQSALLKLFLEIKDGLDLSLPTAKSNTSITFFELDDPENEEHCFVGAFFMNDSWKSSDIFTKINGMAGVRPHEQTEGHVARGEFMLVAISYKYGREPGHGVSHPSLPLCSYYYRSNSLSNSSSYVQTDAFWTDWLRILHNMVIHLKTLSSFRVVGSAPPMEIAAAEFAELPQEILMDIFDLLEFPDLVRVGSVCSSWNSAYSSICNFGQYKYSQAPCLIYTSECAGDHVAFLYSLEEKRAYKLSIPGLHIQRRYLIGSSHGWLVTADERSEMHLVNPVTCEQISLPSVITIEQVTPILDEAGVICRYRFSRHTAKAIRGRSSTYSLSALRDHLFCKALVFYDTSEESYFVVLIHNPFGQLSFARLGDDKWTWLPPHSNFDDCIYKDGLLYAVKLCGAIITFDISTTAVTTKIILDSRTFYGNERVYIVAAPWGDLLQIRRPEMWISKLPHKHGCNCCATVETLRYITIHKVCLASRELVEMNSLDDHVLFLGHNQSLCSRAEEYLHVKPGHIYFTDDCMSVSSKCRSGYRLIIGAFNIQTKSMGEIVSPWPWSGCMAPLWIIPNPRKMELDHRKDGVHAPL